MKRSNIQKDNHAAATQPNARRSPPLPHPRSIRRGVTVLFFGCFFVFLLCYIHPAAIYSGNGIDIHGYVAVMHGQQTSPQHTTAYLGPPFRRPFILELTPEYFQQIAFEPGGWTRLLVTLCIYACRYPIAGALVITVLALLFSWIFSLYIQGTGAQRPFIFRFFPPLFLLTICAWYELRYCTFLFPVIGALAFTVWYQRLRPGSALKATLWLSLLGWLAWYFIQWGSFLVLVCIVIDELFGGKRGRASVVSAAAAHGALLYAADAWFIPVRMTIHWSDFTVLSGLPLAMIVFFPLSATILASWSRLRRAPEGKAAATGEIARASVLACGLVAAALWLCEEPVNRDTRTIARTTHHVLNGQWEAILHEKTAGLFADFSKRRSPLQAFMVHAVDHALCRTGRLGDSLFAFPQERYFDYPLLMLETTLTNGYVNWVVVMDLAMDLGMVNMAERIAGEIMENVGPYPDIMYRRALVQIAKDNKEAAAAYLNKLACMPFYRREAKRLLGMLDNNAALLSETRIAAMRTNRDTVDYFLFTVSYETVFENLLQSNPGNKAAFDYLMTYYLQLGRLDAAAELASKAPAFGYADLPRYWEEALCVYLADNARDPSFKAPFSSLGEQTVRRFNEFAREYLPIANDPAAAAKLAPAFGDSYFYFSVFGHSR